MNRTDQKIYNFFFFITPFSSPGNKKVFFSVERKLLLPGTFSLCINNLGRYFPGSQTQNGETGCPGCSEYSEIHPKETYFSLFLSLSPIAPQSACASHPPPPPSGWPHRMSFYRDACCFHLPSSIFHPTGGNCKVRKQWTISFLLL